MLLRENLIDTLTFHQHYTIKLNNKIKTDISMFDLYYNITACKSKCNLHKLQ